MLSLSAHTAGHPGDLDWARPASPTDGARNVLVSRRLGQGIRVCVWGGGAGKGGMNRELGMTV